MNRKKGVKTMTKRTLVLLTLCFAFSFLLTNPLLAGKCGNGVCNKGEEGICIPDCPGGGGGGTTDPTWCVTLAESTDDGSPTMFRDDRLEEEEDPRMYCDNEAGVFVNLAEDFKVSIDLKKTIRRLVLLQPCLLPGCIITDVLTANTGNLHEYSYDNGVFMEGGALDFQSMTVLDQTYAGLRINFPSDSKSTPHQVLFGNGGGFDCVAEGGSAVSVARTTDSTWTFTATPPLDQACLLEVVEKNQRVFIGLVHVPLKMTVKTLE